MNHPSVKDRELMCIICLRVFTLRNALTMHMRVHANLDQANNSLILAMANFVKLPRETKRYFKWWVMERC
jgi:hypothetical protein